MASTTVASLTGNGFFKSPHPCDRCRLHRKSVEAIVFCEDCRKYMCASCCQLHQQETVKQTDSNGTNTMSSANGISDPDAGDEVNGTENFSEELQKWSTFVREQLENGTEDGRFKPDRFNSSLNTEIDIDQARSECTSLLQQYQTIKSKRQRQIKNLEKQWESAIKKIHETRLEVTVLLDNIEGNVKTKLKSIRESESEFLSEHVRTGESVSLILEYVLERMDAALRKGDAREITKATRFANSMIRRYNSLIASMTSTVIHSQIEFEPSDEILYVIKNLSTFGDVAVARNKACHSEFNKLPSESFKAFELHTSQDAKQNLSKPEPKEAKEEMPSNVSTRKVKELTQDDLDSIEAEIKLIIEDHRQMKTEKKRKERAAFVAGQKLVSRSLPDRTSRYFDDNYTSSPTDETEEPCHKEQIHVSHSFTEARTQIDKNQNDTDDSCPGYTSDQEEEESNVTADNKEKEWKRSAVTTTPIPSPRSKSPKSTSSRSVSPVVVTLRLSSPKHSPSQYSSKTNSIESDYNRSSSPKRPVSPSFSRSASHTTKPYSSVSAKHKDGRQNAVIESNGKVEKPRQNYDRPKSPKHIPLTPRSSSPLNTTQRSRSISPQVHSQRPMSPQMYKPWATSPQISPKSSRKLPSSAPFPRPKSPRTPCLTSSPKRNSRSRNTATGVNIKGDFNEDADDGTCSADSSLSEPITAVEILATKDKKGHKENKATNVVNQYRQRFENMLQDMSNSLNSSLEMSENSSDVSSNNLRPSSPSRQRKRISKDPEVLTDGYRAGSPVRMTGKHQCEEMKNHPFELKALDSNDKEIRVGVKLPNMKGNEIGVISHLVPDRQANNINSGQITPKETARSKSPIIEQVSTPKTSSKSAIAAVQPKTLQDYQAAPSQRTSCRSPIPAERGHNSRPLTRSSEVIRDRKSGSPTVRFDTKKNTYHDLSVQEEDGNRGTRIEKGDNNSIKPQLKSKEQSCKHGKQDNESAGGATEKFSEQANDYQRVETNEGQQREGSYNRRSEFRTSCKLIGKFDVAESSNGVPGFISGIARIQRGYIIVDWNGNSLNFVGDDFRCRSELSVPAGPWKVARIGDGSGLESEYEDEIVVTLPLTCQLQFFHLAKDDGLVAGHIIEVNCSCRDIAYSKGELIVSTSDPYTIRVMGIDGDVRRTIQYDSCGYNLFDSSIRLTVSQDGRLIYVSEYCSGVTALTREGEIIFSYTKDDVKSSTGLAVDGSGDVYVASAGKDAVVKMTKEGKRIADLARNDVHKPEAVFYSADTDRLIVTSSTSSSIAVYSLH